MQFEYSCPECGCTDGRHPIQCDFRQLSKTDLEKAHVDIISRLSVGPCDKDTLKDEIHGEWGQVHDEIVRELIQYKRASLTEDQKLTLIPPSDSFDSIDPQREPLKTIYQQGSYPGAHDNSLFALISWYESVGLSWQQTKDKVIKWLEQSGAWDRGGFKEESKEAVVEKKQHVYRRDYGWRNKGEAAKRVIDQKRQEQNSRSASVATGD